MVSTSSFRSIIDHGTRCVSSRQCAPCSNKLAKVFRVKIWSNDCHIDNVCLLCDFFLFATSVHRERKSLVLVGFNNERYMCILLYTLFTFILNTVNQECDLASVQSVKQTNASMCSCCAAFLKIFFLMTPRRFLYSRLLYFLSTVNVASMYVCTNRMND